MGLNVEFKVQNVPKLNIFDPELVYMLYLCHRMGLNVVFWGIKWAQLYFWPRMRLYVVYLVQNGPNVVFMAQNGPICRIFCTEWAHI